MPTKIPFSDCEVSAEKVVIKGAGGQALAQSLIQKNALTLAELADKFGFIHPEKISFGADGSVHLSDPGVAAKVQTFLAKGGGGGEFFDTNCSCGKGGI